MQLVEQKVWDVQGAFWRKVGEVETSLQKLKEVEEGIHEREERRLQNGEGERWKMVRDIEGLEQKIDR